MNTILSNKQVSENFSVYQEIINQINAFEFNSFILIVPTNRIQRYLSKYFLEISVHGILPKINIFTLETFFKFLYSKISSNKYFLDIDLQSVLFDEAITSLSKKKSLKYFHTSKDHKLPAGTFDKIISIITKFKESGITPEIMEKEISLVREREVNNYNDLIEIYKNYERLLIDRFEDNGDIIINVIKAFQKPFHNELFSSAFPDVKKIYIKGFSEFSMPEICLINSLFSLENISVVLDMNYNDANRQLFGHLDSILTSLQFNHIWKNISSSVLDTTRYIENNLFKKPSLLPPLDCRDTINLFTSKSRIEEIETIFKTIKDILTENPEQDISKICIITQITDKYTNLFREISEKYEIAVNITDRFILSNSFMISSLISFLEIPVNNFRRNDIFRAILSPYLSFKKPDGNLINVHNLFNIANNLKILFGKNSWLEKIDRRLNYLLKNISLQNEDDKRVYQKEIVNLELAKEDISYFFSCFTPLSFRLRPSDFMDSIRQILKKTNLAENIIKSVNNIENTEAEKDFRAFSKFLSILDNMLRMYELKEMKKEKKTMNYYLDDLKIAISKTRYNIRQKNGYGIFISAAEEIREINFDYVFLAGLNEGDFPSKYELELFKPEIKRKSEEEHYRENRFLFYQAITGFSKKLFLSYPLFESDSELIPSSFLNSLREIVKINIMSDAENKDTIYCKQDLLKFIGKNQEHISEQNLNIYDNSEEIERKQKIEKSRMKNHSLVQYEGYLTNENEFLNSSIKKSIKEKEYSISELEKYAKCPMQYFFDKILHIAVFEIEDDDISSLEMGSLIHDILFEYYQRMKSDKKLIPDKNGLSENISLIKAIASEKIEMLNITNPFFKLGFEKVIGDGLNRKGLLQQFVEYEMSDEKIKKFLNHEFLPYFFEVSFGSNTGSAKNADKDLSMRKSITINDVKMRGKIDRIDFNKEENRLYFIIYDYKTGNFPSTSEIEEGTALQIPLYIEVAKRLLLEFFKCEISPIGGLYYSINSPIEIKPLLILDGFFDKRSKSRRNQDDFDSILTKTENFISDYVSKISSGCFNLPLNKKKLKQICKYCDFEKICRIKTIKFFDDLEENSQF